MPLPRAAAEVCRQLREMAQSAGVRVQIDELPDVEVNAGAVELCLTNYVSNAIKYADPAREDRWVRVWSRTERARRGGCELVIAVEDNGLGVPEEARDKLFSRFFRAHGTVTGVEGTGLGLSIVRDTVEGLGGRAWAEFDGVEGSRFLLSLPCRRSADRERRGGAPAAMDSGGARRLGFRGGTAPA